MTRGLKEVLTSGSPKEGTAKGTQLCHGMGKLHPTFKAKHAVTESQKHILRP